MDEKAEIGLLQNFCTKYIILWNFLWAFIQMIIKLRKSVKQNLSYRSLRVLAHLRQCTAPLLGKTIDTNYEPAASRDMGPSLYLKALSCIFQFIEFFVVTHQV